MTRYFNGFSLNGEERLFSPLIPDGSYVAAGFSYGAVRAFEYALEAKVRIDRLVLFSPAFFQTMPPAFSRLQLKGFARDREGYLKRFLAQCAAPASFDLHPFLAPGTKEELEWLLSYVWECEKIEALKKRGVVIEVFLGAKDQVIDPEGARAFFSPHATVYWMKHAGHILKEE